MDVHGPETGDQELAAGIDYSPALRDRYFAGFSEISNVGAGDDNGHITLRRPAGNIDDREMGQDQRFLLRISSPASEEQGWSQEKKGIHSYHVNPSFRVTQDRMCYPVCYSTAAFGWVEPSTATRMLLNIIGPLKFFVFLYYGVAEDDRDFDIGRGPEDHQS